ncbi:MAG TPA: aldo/keto reductase [Aggregatilineales bacterium]|nr:aldo/keto reductase [Aggregatilineales bacterium]
MSVPRIPMASGDLQLSQIIPGLMRLLQWNLSREQLIGWINTCIDLGMTSFDHADIYGSYQVEAAFGEALAASPGLRDRIEIVTKCGIALVSPQRPAHTVHHYNTTRQHIIASAERSLRNFQTDRLDLLLIHRPDALMDADEVAAALNELLNSGKVRAIGVSNFTPFQWDLLQSRLDTPLVTNQVELSLTFLDTLHDGTLDQAQQLRRPPMIWSPLAGGRLFSQNDERSVRVRAVLERIAAAHGVAPDVIALAWVLAHPSKPLPVLGTGNLDRIRASVQALTVTLDRQEWFALWEASAGREVP